MAFSTRSGGGRVQTQTALADINITPLVDVVLRASAHLHAHRAGASIGH